MAPNETSALLKNYQRDQQQHQQQNTKDCCNNNNNKGVNFNNNGGSSGGYHTMDDNNHIVYVNKDPSEYEPIFCLNDYSSALTLDELLPYKVDPWWQNLRRILFFTFWLMLLITFLTACLLSYLQAGLATCNILAKQLSTAGSIEVSTSPLPSEILANAASTLPTTIAKVLTTDLLAGKIASP